MRGRGIFVRTLIGLGQVVTLAKQQIQQHHILRNAKCTSSGKPRNLQVKPRKLENWQLKIGNT